MKRKAKLRTIKKVGEKVKKLDYNIENRVQFLIKQLEGIDRKKIHEKV